MEIYVHAGETILPMILPSEQRISTSWADLCQDVVQNLLMATDSRLILQILIEISPTKERFTHYLVRFGGGNASIIRVDWSSSVDIIPPLAACIDVNMILKPRVSERLRRLAQPHLPVQLMGMPFPATLHVDLCVSVVSSTVLPFPYNEDQISVLYLKEDEQFPGCVDTFSIFPADGHHDLLPMAIRLPQASSTAAVAITVGTTVFAGEKRKASTTASVKEEVMSSKKKKKKNRGEVQSIVDPYFYQNYPGVLDAGFKVLDYLYLHPSHAPWIAGAGLLLAAESCYGNDAKMNLHREHYLRQSFGKTDTSSIPADENTRVCFVYGAGYGARTFGTVQEQTAYREWTAEMQIIADAIEKEVVKRFSTDKGVIVTSHLNELEVISFYDGKKITFHRDQTYTADGKFCSNNCQKQHTCTCIFVLGDERVLEFQLFLGKKKSEVNHPEAQKMIRLTNGALFFLHPEDEEDSLRKIFKMKERTHFKRRNNGVKGKGNLLSTGLVFRTCVQTRTVYKDTGQLVVNSSSKPTDTVLKCMNKLEEYEKWTFKDPIDECLKKKYLSMKERHHKGD